MRLLSLEARLASGTLAFAAARLRAAIWKANFDPNQPRIPRGDPHGGRWTRVGEESSPDKVQLAQGDPPPPDIPPTRPARGRDRNKVIKEVARWAKRAIRLTHIGKILALLEASSWLEGEPLILSYLDEPKSLDELRAAVWFRQRAY